MRRVGMLVGSLTMFAHSASAQPAHASFAERRDMSFEHTLVAFDFDGDSPFGNRGTARVVTEVRGDPDALSIADGAPGYGRALRFPAFSSRGGATPVVVTVRPQAPGGLDVGNGRFGVGADIRLDSRSCCSSSDNGNNVVQRGLYNDAAQFKIQVDDGTVSCRISGSGGIVFVRDSEPIKPQTWYRVGCVRDGDEVTLTVAEFDTSPSSHRRHVTTGRTGELRFSDAPIAIGGKVYSNGAVVTGDSDQFNGFIDNVVFGTDGPTANNPPLNPSTAMPAGSTLELQVTGVAGVPLNADAVVLNMTAVNAQAPGFATVYPCGRSRPEASNLNYAAGQTIPNLVIAQPGAGGKVCIYSFAAIDVLADVSGYFPAGSGFTALSNPTRVLDTRNGIGAPAARVGAGSTLELQVTGVAGVPLNADAVVLNMTAVNAQAPGFATVYPCGRSRPEASNLNYAAGQTIPNLVIAQPGAGGKVCIYSFAAIDVLADVSGYFPAGSGFTALSNPTRVLDTRNGIGAPAARVGAGSTLELQVTGVAGVPLNADAVVLNMTAVNARAPGFATVYPCGRSRPEASNLNYAAGQTIPNLVIAQPGAGGKVCIYSFAAIDVLADVSGFFPAGSGFTALSNPTRVLDTRNGIG
jgi:hypothetical protein